MIFMKILFLDHWGTICLADKHGREHNKTDLPNINEMRIHGSLDNFDKEAVNVLNSIIAKTDFEVVISSDWKKWCSLDKMKEFYKEQGIIKPPLDYTPTIKGNIFKTRALEIMAWLSINSIDKWVAIDDLYLGDYLSNFVWISKTDEGITQKGIKENILIYI